MWQYLGLRNHSGSSCSRGDILGADMIAILNQMLILRIDLIAKNLDAVQYIGPQTPTGSEVHYLSRGIHHVGVTAQWCNTKKKIPQRSIDVFDYMNYLCLNRIWFKIKL